jgi:hypothetical protein
MDFIYIIFLLLVILASLFIYFIFGKGWEPMVTIGSDLTAPIDIPGATYSGPNPNNKEKGINGYDMDPPKGYYKIEVGGGVWKMKPIIPTGYIINPSDNTKLIVNPKNSAVSSAISYYKNTTDELLRKGPYTEIPLPTSEQQVKESTPLPKNINGKKKVKKSTPLPKNIDGTPKFYRIAPFKDANGKQILDKYMMKPLPEPLPKGYIIDAKDYLIFNPDVTEYAFSTFDSAYDPTNRETIYNNMQEVEKEQIDNDDIGKYYSFDANGQLIREENTDANFSPVLYYVPGAYKYGSSNYVPNYEDSVYLSRTTRLPQQAPVFNTAGMLGGFCTQFKNNTLAIEEKCGALDLNTCASTSCCTLIGGQKCVAGSENGPSNPANYTDYNLRNKDFYYYQGKCYGNCR